jgi:integrase
MPYALARKYPNASAGWRWQWVFPQENRWKNRATREEGRHHVDETILQRAVKEAVGKAGIVRHVTCHTFRHYAEFRTMPSKRLIDCQSALL